jgi:uncharacterized protein YndB with AHSA1/START domain
MNTGKRVALGPLGAILLVAITLSVGACGDSLDSLNKLAAAGSIQDAAPVKAEAEIQIAAPPSRVWDLLVGAHSWPQWNKQIESVSAPDSLGAGVRFTWKTGGSTIHSQVQLFDPESRLGWTGTALTAKAVHIWELKPLSGNATLVKVRESMDGPFMAKLYPSEKLAEADRAWLAALKRAAEGEPQG